MRAIAFAARAGYQLAAARAFVVDDYFFPMYVIRPRPGTVRLQVWHAAGAFKKFGYSVLDRSFGADEDLVRRVAIHGNYTLALVSSMAVAPFYAEAFGQPVDLFASRFGLPRTDLFADAERRDRALARLRATYGLPDGRRIVLYAPTFRGDTVGRARYDDLLDLRVMHEVLGDDHVGPAQAPPVRAHRPRDPAGPRRVRDRRLGRPRPQRADARRRRPRDRLLERDLRVRAPRPADRVPRPRRRRVRAASAASTSTSRRDLPGPVFATTAELAAAIRADAFDLERVRAFAAAAFDVVDGRSTRADRRRGAAAGPAREPPAP